MDSSAISERGGAVSHAVTPMPGLLPRPAMGVPGLELTMRAVQQAMQERNEAKARQFRGVQRLALGLVSGGALILLLTILLANVLLAPGRSNNSGRITQTRQIVRDDEVSAYLLALAYLLVSMGLLALSTIPVGQLDLNVFMRKHVVIRVALVLVSCATMSLDLLYRPLTSLALTSAGAAIVWILWLVLDHLTASRRCQMRSGHHIPEFTTVFVVLFMVIGWGRVCGAAGSIRTLLQAMCGYQARVTRNDATGPVNATVNSTPLPNWSNLSAAMRNCTLAIDDPGSPVTADFLLVDAILGFVATFILIGLLAWNAIRLRSFSSTLVWWWCMYILVAKAGVSVFLRAVPYYYYYTNNKLVPPYIAQGLAFLAPPLFVMVMGRNRLFGLMTRRFDRERAKVDGAMMSALLAMSTLRLGAKFWIHHGEDRGDQFPDPFDPRRNWRQGTIIRITSDQFAVLPDGEGTTMKGGTRLSARRGSAVFEDALQWFPVKDAPPPSAAGFELYSQNLLEEATESLRCVEGKQLFGELFRASKADDLSLQVVPRPLKPDETIDFFISHSWHDPWKLKWTKLQDRIAVFGRQHGSLPTFWFDKVCIDQNNIANGLKTLMVNVMACKKVLVICGKTYMQRLWCALELFTLFAFSDNDEVALGRVEFLAIEEDGSSLLSILNALVNFELDDAHCYDPNEETHLRHVMQAVGNERFVQRIQMLGKKLVKVYDTAAHVDTSKSSSEL